ncbi:MAG: hypothetical protein V7786_01885 [Sulfitobacter litoralis]|uniref:hypothetical protein n=1 Tax=Sulfitobacter litoralis TaxID=335975 RepID=UPI00300292B9
MNQLRYRTDIANDRARKCNPHVTLAQTPANEESAEFERRYARAMRSNSVPKQAQLDETSAAILSVLTRDLTASDIVTLSRIDLDEKALRRKLLAMQEAGLMHVCDTIDSVSIYRAGTGRKTRLTTSTRLAMAIAEAEAGV